jgi:hypothetical protein
MFPPPLMPPMLIIPPSRHSEHAEQGNHNKYACENR